MAEAADVAGRPAHAFVYDYECCRVCGVCNALADFDIEMVQEETYLPVWTMSRTRSPCC